MSDSVEFLVHYTLLRWKLTLSIHICMQLKSFYYLIKQISILCVYKYICINKIGKTRTKRNDFEIQWEIPAQYIICTPNFTCEFLLY